LASVEVGSERRSCFQASIALSGVASWTSETSAISSASARARASLAGLVPGAGSAFSAWRRIATSFWASPRLVWYAR